MMAQESKDDKQIIKAMIDLVTSCTFGKVDISNLPTYDVEFMFLKIRGKSAGESVELNLVCPDDNQTKVQTKVNLDDIQVQMTVGHSNIIDITDDIKLYLRHPLFSDAIALGDSVASDGVFKLLNSCIIKIVYGDTEYNRIDITDKDIEEFIDSLNTEQFGKIREFFDTMPQLKHTAKYTCSTCGEEKETTITGLNSFFG